MRFPIKLRRGEWDAVSLARGVSRFSVKGLMVLQVTECLTTVQLCCLSINAVASRVSERDLFQRSL